jgi:hypothetical protein
MGLFDAFKKKVEQKSEAVNPLYNALKGANLDIHNLQVVNTNGSVTLTGEVEDGRVIDEATSFLNNQPGVQTIDNKLTIADISAKNIVLKVTTRGSNLNVRKGPSTKNEIVGKYPNGTEVTLVKRINKDWAVVRNNELEGYCHMDYLK